jgi:hypothetical protein
MKIFAAAAVASLLALSAGAWGQSANTVGSKATNGDGSTIGTAGSAAAGGTSASTIGLGAHSGSSSSIAGAGSAAAAQGKIRSDTKIRENPQMLQARSKATAQDGGTWSKSATNTRVKHNGDLSSRTRSMSHEPGGKPAMSKTRMR